MGFPFSIVFFRRTFDQSITLLFKFTATRVPIPPFGYLSEEGMSQDLIAIDLKGGHHACS